MGATDYLWLLAETAEELHRTVMEWHEALYRNGLKVNANETEVMVMYTRS